MHSYVTEWSGLAGTSVGHPVQPPAQAGPPTAGCRGPCPGGSGISPEKETPQPPWAARLAPTGCLRPTTVRGGRRRLRGGTGWSCRAPRCQPSCPDRSSGTARPCHCVSAWPSPTCKPRATWPSASCLLLTLRSSSTGKKKRAKDTSPSFSCPVAPTWLYHPQPSLAHPPAQPRWSSQRFAKP